MIKNTDITIGQVAGGVAADFGDILDEALGESSSRDKITANQNTVIINGNNNAESLNSEIGITVGSIASVGGTATKLEANNNSAI